jgi:glucose-6-phosphate isomerase
LFFLVKTATLCRYTLPTPDGDIVFDLSKNIVDDRVLAQLLSVAIAAGVEQRRADMFAGVHVNLTEHRAVLHVALRNRSNTPMLYNGKDVSGVCL